MLHQETKENLQYYCAFSYLSINPWFKTRVFQFFDYDIKKAFLANEKELKELVEKENITIPKDYFYKKNKLSPIECYNKAFLDKNVKIITYNDKQYPPLLKQIPDFPLSLYYKGNIDIINYDHALAIVGSRKASQEAKIALNNILSDFKNSNLCVVSGLAYGIDTQAHTSAIENNIKTIGVIGSGLDITYPIQNKRLYQKIEEDSGVIFSEYPLKTKPFAYNFPQRNRIVTGMSKGTLVAEAQLKSGAMISANLTLEYNRELMCIPGNITNPNTTGIYHLIKNGASIVCNSKDLLNCLDWDIIENNNNFKIPLSDIQKKIFESVELEAQTFDSIVIKTKEKVSMVMVSLTELELKGLIKQVGNKYYKII